VEPPVLFSAQKFIGRLSVQMPWLPAKQLRKNVHGSRIGGQNVSGFTQMEKTEVSERNNQPQIIF
jgi:hypothetical protein